MAPPPPCPDDGLEPARPGAVVPLRRNRDFVLFWSSQVVSTVGTRATAVAYPLLVLQATGSPGQAGLVGFAQTLPFLVFFLPAGVVVDRADRKRIMLTAEVVRFLVMATIVASLATVGFHVWVLLLTALVEGTAFIFFELSEVAALPHLVPPEQIPAALAQNQARQQGADLVGQPLGGFLFGLGRAVPFAVDAATYVVSFVALTMIRPAFQDRRHASRATMRADIAEGVRWLWNQPFLRTIVGLVAVWNFVSAALLLALIVRAQDLGASPTAIGLILAGFGAGAIVGAIAAPTVQRTVRGRTVIAGAIWVTAAAMVLLVVIGSPAGLGVVVAVASVVGTPFNVVIGSYRYALTPDRLQGRVVSAARVVAWGSIPLGSLAVGFVLEAVGAVTTLAGLAGVMALVAVAASAAPSIRAAPRHPSQADGG